MNGGPRPTNKTPKEKQTERALGGRDDRTKDEPKKDQRKR